MITRENIRTLGDLLETAAVDYENQVFVRYEKDGIVYEKGYRTFAMDTRAVAHWTMNKCGELGKKLHVAIIGKCSYEYLTVLMGVAAAGSIAIPMDVQLSKEGFIENLNRAEADIIFFDYEYFVFTGCSSICLLAVLGKMQLIIVGRKLPSRRPVFGDQDGSRS